LTPSPVPPAGRAPTRASPRSDRGLTIICPASKWTYQINGPGSIGYSQSIAILGRAFGPRFAADDASGSDGLLLAYGLLRRRLPRARACLLHITFRLERYRGSTRQDGADSVLRTLGPAAAGCFVGAGTRVISRTEQGERWLGVGRWMRRLSEAAAKFER
jgi:hypothetical protein